MIKGSTQTDLCCWHKGITWRLAWQRARGGVPNQFSVANTKVLHDVEPGSEQGGYPISSLSPTQRYYTTLSLATSKGGTQSVLCRQHKGTTWRWAWQRARGVPSQFSVANTKVLHDVEPGNEQGKHPVSSLSPTQSYYMTLSLATRKGSTQSVLFRQHKVNGRSG